MKEKYNLSNCQLSSITQSCLTLSDPIDTKSFLSITNSWSLLKLLWDAANVVLRGKFVAIISYIKKLEGYQIKSQTLQLKDLEKEKK